MARPPLAGLPASYASLAVYPDDAYPCDCEGALWDMDKCSDVRHNRLIHEWAKRTVSRTIHKLINKVGKY